MARMLITLLLATVSAFALWPLPTQFHTGSVALVLSQQFHIQVDIRDAPSDLLAAVSQTNTYLQTDKLERLVVGRSATDARAIHGAKALPSLKLSLAGKVRSISEEAVDHIENRDESYTLNVPDDGTGAVLKANSSLGLFRGLTTFAQLWYDHHDSGTSYTLVAPIQITDAPAYPYRGLMLDTSRNFFPVADIKRTLDAMSWVKINIFHWHVVDSQSFPLVIPGFTELSSAGAYSPKSVYTTSDVKDIVSYAAARGIDVLVEIDVPGHTSVISKSHPEHVACAEAKPWASFANEPPAGQLRFATLATVNFTTSLLAAAAQLFPSKMLSTGGDELNVNCYANDTQTQQALQTSGKTLEQALDLFTQSTHGVLIEQGKTPVVWEEMVLAHNVTLSKNTIAMVWISSDNVKAVAAKGFRVVHAASDYFYLDCGGGEWIGDFPSGNSWCDPFKTWQHSYTFNPTANLTADESRLVLGGQHLLWTEQSSPSNLDPIVWPRAASSAELFWTGAGQDVESALPRLHDVAFRFIQRGVNAIPLQPLWCALRPEACDLTA